MAGIKAEFTEGKPFAMVIGYPRSWLTPVGISGSSEIERG
jgi:hypothetical protein